MWGWGTRLATSVVDAMKATTTTIPAVLLGGKSHCLAANLYRGFVWVLVAFCGGAPPPPPPPGPFPFGPNCMPPPLSQAHSSCKNLIYNWKTHFKCDENSKKMWKWTFSMHFLVHYSMHLPPITCFNVFIGVIHNLPHLIKVLRP
jgi:hypothetical protein